MVNGMCSEQSVEGFKENLSREREIRTCNRDGFISVKRFTRGRKRVRGDIQSSGKEETGEEKLQIEARTNETPWRRGKRFYFNPRGIMRNIGYEHYDTRCRRTGRTLPRVHETGEG